MQFVVKLQTLDGEKTYATEWERNMVADFGDGLKKAAMIYSNDVVVASIGAFGLTLETFKRVPKVSPTEKLR